MQLPVVEGVRLVGERSDLVAREARLWLIETADGARGVLRRNEPDSIDATSARALEDLGWLHSYLARLGATAFRAPVPLQLWDGRSFCVEGGAVWEALSYVPGHRVGWDPNPPLRALGRLLAHYHDAAQSLGVIGQRPVAFPLAGLAELIWRPGLPPAPTWLADLCAELHDRLPDTTTASSSPVVVIHGDFTAHTVLAAGQPPVPVGAIDFNLAHVERPVADVAFGLWRMGRPYQSATWLDLGRVAAFVGGYGEARQLTPTDIGLIPLCLWGRGVQMAAKAFLRGRAVPSTCPAQIGWLHDSEQRLCELIVSASA
ncbi:MAG: phosphotransferase [Acidimicrobiales bacterium]|nr:phosphotransferase [Acidimicrobiales bacterium]